MFSRRQNITKRLSPKDLKGRNLLRLDRDALGLGGHALAELVLAVDKDLVEVVLVPADVRVEAGELPDAVDLAVPVVVGGVGVALDGDLGAGRVGVALVRHAQLVRAEHLRVRDLLPLGAPDEVLRLEQRVPQHRRRRDHRHELLRRHRLPQLVDEGAVVNLYTND